MVITWWPLASWSVQYGGIQNADRKVAFERMSHEGLFLLSADVEIKLDGEGFVLPLTADEDVHRR